MVDFIWSTGGTGGTPYGISSASASATAYEYIPENTPTRFPRQEKSPETIKNFLI